MNKLIAFTLATGSGLTLVAAPVVSNVTMTQDAGRTVTINYTLSGEPGIVTVDVQTNAGDNVWVSIGGRHLTHFAGDVNKKVETGARSMTWKPRKAWPDNEVTENVKAVVSAWALNAPPDYMVVSLTVANSTEFYVSADAVPFGVTNGVYKTDKLLMRKIPAANVKWRMGSPTTPEELGRNEKREIPHYVTLGEDFYIGVYPVTQRQYERVMDARPSNFKLNDDYAMRPVEKVSYEDIRGKADEGYDWPSDTHAVNPTNFVGRLRLFTGVGGFDLPVEAQWEFACRARCGAALYNGKELSSKTTSSALNPLARYKTNGGYVDGTTAPANTCTAANGTAKVGWGEPNDWGLYDMLGNVYEWCLDWFQESPIVDDVAKGPNEGSYRVDRGGSWDATASSCRCAYRSRTSASTRSDNIGFRLACSVDMQSGVADFARKR